VKITTIRRRDPEHYQRAAAGLIARRLTVRRPVRRRTPKKCAALSALLDLIAGDLRDLPLKERLPFFLSSVEIVAETLAALPRRAAQTRPSDAVLPA
jgi:hypothetical protein